MTSQRILNLTEEELLERREELRSWGAEQIKKYALRQDKVACVVYWETKATKAEKKNGLSKDDGIVCNAYDYLNGEHHYLKERCVSGRTQEFVDVFGEDAIFFFLRKSSYHETSKLYVKRVDNGALLVQHLSFEARKPFKKEYGTTSSFGGYSDFVCIITQDKDILLFDSRYDVSLYRLNIRPDFVKVYTSKDFRGDTWMAPDISNLRFDDAGEGAYGETYRQMILRECVGNIRPYYVGSSTNILDIGKTEYFREFLCFKDLKITNSKRQKTVERLCSMLEKDSIDESLFDEIASFDEESDEYDWYRWSSRNNISAFAQKLPDDTIVIRYVYEKSGVKFEGYRLFVNQDGFIGTKKDFYENWVAVNATQDASAWSASRFFLEKGIFDTPIKNILYYTRNQLLSIDEGKDGKKPTAKHVTEFIYSLLRYPILESSLKVGIGLDQCGRYDNMFQALQARVGVVLDNEKNLNKALGLNAHQINYLVENPKSEIVKDIKNILIPCERNEAMVRGYRYYGRDNSEEQYLSLQDMDNKTFDHMVNFIKEISAYAINCRISDSSFSRYLYGSIYQNQENPVRKPEDINKCEYNVKTVLRIISSFYGREVAFSDGIMQMLKMFASKHYELLKELEENSENSGNGYRSRYLDYQSQPFNIYTDYLRMAVQINDKSIAPARLSSYEEAIDAHDSLTVIMNSKQEEFEAKMLEELKSEWAKYTMENDDYAVIYPKEPKDIIAEGRALSHCVASFVRAVAAGTTTILFLRSKKDINKSLLTIEVKDGKVRQAHGFANCTLDSMEEANPGINKFFFDWAKKKKLKADHINGMYAAAM